MARRPRLHVPGAVYHVILRGNGGQSIFAGDEDREKFAEGVDRFGHRIHGYCWMGNHIHLAIQAGNVPLSRIMQNLAFRHTRWVNRRERRTGHLFQGRFKAVLVDAEAYLLELVRYIHLNPARAGLVEDPPRYPSNGHRTYLGLERTPWLTTRWVHSHFAKQIELARERYTRFVADGIGERRRPGFHTGSAQARLLGDERFVERVLRDGRRTAAGRAPTGANRRCRLSRAACRT